MKVCFDSKFATISVREEKKIAYLAWKPSAQSEDYKAVLEKSLEIISENEIVAWIPDNTEARVVSPEDRKWAEEHFIPEAIARGVRWMAFVFPSEDAFKKYYASKLKEAAQSKGVNFEIFADGRDAERWILKQLT
jgi:hypothetical protein